MLTVPYRFLFPAIMAFCAIGVYSLSNNTFDVYCAAVFAVIGFAFHKLGFEPAPLILGFVLGPMMEENLRRALLMARGDWSVFLTRPIAATMIALAMWSLSCGAWGAWSVATALMVLSASAARTASTCSSVRSGGLTLKVVSYPTTSGVVRYR